MTIFAIRETPGARMRHAGVRVTVSAWVLLSTHASLRSAGKQTGGYRDIEIAITKCIAIPYRALSRLNSQMCYIYHIYIAIRYREKIDPQF